jgi:hypothetical protein
MKSETNPNALLLAIGYAAEGFRVQYGAIRCASMAGLNIYVLGTPEAAVLRYSRYCQAFTELKGWQGRLEDQVELIETSINKAVSDHGIDIILPADRDSTCALGMLKERLGISVFPVPANASFKRIDDKWTFRDLCMELGVPTPRSWLFETKEDLLAASRGGDIPEQLIVKPTRLSGQRGVMKVGHNDLEAQLRKVDYVPILLQEFIDGVDYHCTIVAMDGRSLGKLTYVDRPEAKYFGCDADILLEAEKIVNRLKLNGILNFDTRRTATGEIYFLECNPRPFMSMQMCAQAGINCIEIGMHAIEGGSDTPIVMKTKSIRKWRGMIREGFLPWKLSKDDWRKIKDTVLDPVQMLYEISEFANRKLLSNIPLAGLRRALRSGTDSFLGFAASGVRELSRLRRQKSPAGFEAPSEPSSQ